MSAFPVLNVFPRRPSKRRRPARRRASARSRSAALARLATSALSLGTALGAALFVVAPPFESPRFALFAQTTQTASTTQTEDALLAAALEQHRAGNYADAVQRLEAFIAQYPNSPNRNKAELFAGHALLALGEFVDPASTAAARSHFQYIVNQGKNAEYYKEATFHNAHSYYNLRQYSEAQPLFTQFLTDFPNDAYVQYVYYYLGVCEAQSGAYDAALNYFNRNLTEYPTSPLRWTCRLAKAAAVGKSGNYQEAENQLNALAAEPEIPVAVAGQVVVQRALLQIVQQNFDEAIRILDEFVKRYQNDPDSTQNVQDAYLYEAYAYFAKKEFERALLLVEQMERAATTIPPETALFKIKLLVNLNRVDEASALLNKLESAPYGQETPDAIASYRALISLARGDWDAAIASLTTLLKVRTTGAGPVALNYYNAGGATTGNQLAPHDFVEACGVLILSYASRYASKKAASDQTMQEAVFRATARYAQSLNDPALKLIVQMIDKRRAEALTKPIDSSSGSVSVATPPGSVAPPPNAFPNPTDPSAPQQGGASYAPGANGLRPGRPSGRPFPPGFPNAAPDAGTAGTAGTPNAAPDAGTTPESKPLTPSAARVALDKATNFFLNQEYDRANETLLEAMTSSETFWQDCPVEAPRVALLRANVLYALNKRSEAQLMCQELLANAPYSPEASVAAFFLGYAADSLGRRDDAIKYLGIAANARTVSPFADVALYYLATNEWERGNVKLAEQNFERFYRFYPQSPYWSHAVWALAQIKFDANDVVDAEKLVNEALAKNPDAAIVDYLLFLKGQIALQAKDYEKARVAFEWIVDLYPDGRRRKEATTYLNQIPERFRNPSPVASEPTPERPSVGLPNGGARPRPSRSNDDRRGPETTTPNRASDVRRGPETTTPNRASDVRRAPETTPPNRAPDVRRGPASAAQPNDDRRGPETTTPNRASDERRASAAQPTGAPSDRSSSNASRRSGAL